MKRNTFSRILNDNPEKAGDPEVQATADELDDMDVLANLSDSEAGEALRKYHKKRIISLILDILEAASKPDVELRNTIAKLDAELSIARYVSNARSQADALHQAIDELLK